MKDFFDRRPESGAGENYRKIALETVENNIKFIQNYSHDIQAWLATNTQPWNASPIKMTKAWQRRIIIFICFIR